MKDFEFHRPTTIAEAVALLKQKPEAKLLSGGQSLLPVLKLELAEPSDLISLAGIKELKDIPDLQLLSIQGTKKLTAGGTPIAPTSPTPLTPSGLCVHAVTWLPTLKFGRSAARGIT